MAKPTRETPIIDLDIARIDEMQFGQIVHHIKTLLKLSAASTGGYAAEIKHNEGIEASAGARELARWMRTLYPKDTVQRQALDNLFEQAEEAVAEFWKRFALVIDAPDLTASVKTAAVREAKDSGGKKAMNMRQNLTPRGAAHPNSVFKNDEEVAIIKQRIVNGEDVSDIARAIDKNYATVASIRDNRSWNHIPWPKQPDRNLAPLSAGDPNATLVTQTPQSIIDKTHDPARQGQGNGKEKSNGKTKTALPQF